MNASQAAHLEGRLGDVAALRLNVTGDVNVILLLQLRPAGVLTLLRLFFAIG